MTMVDGKKQRQYIRKHVGERRDLDFKNLSIAIGKNESYIHQFLTRSSPRALRSEDMKVIVEIIEEKGPTTANTVSLVNVPVYGFRAGMGGGGVVLSEEPEDYWPMRPQYLRHLRLESAKLIAIEVEGDSMSPTLHSGDQVLINERDKNPARGGIFAVHDSDTLVVKRIEKVPNSSPIMLKLISDNQHHTTYDVLADNTNIIGRVVWFARRI